VKYTSLRHQVAVLRAMLPGRGLVIKISGGLPPAAATPVEPLPPGRELKAQAGAFRRHPRQAPAESAGESAAAGAAWEGSAAADSSAAPAGRIDQGLAPPAAAPPTARGGIPPDLVSCSGPRPSHQGIPKC
jgi:hypothetical protein